MIDHGWRSEVTGNEREQLHRLLTEAADADADAGFPSFALDDDVSAGTRYLLVWLLPDERTGRDEPPPTLAGCLRLQPRERGDGAEVRLVIHPELRSRGIATSLCEQLGLADTSDDTAVDDTDRGWAGTGCSRLYCWARGDHPAAQRMSLRFSRTGLRRARREWRLLALLRSSPGDEAAEALSPADPGKPGVDALWRDAGRPGPPPSQGRVLIAGPDKAPHGAVWFDAEASEPTEFGQAGVLHALVLEPDHADSPVVASLLGAGMAALRDDGCKVAVITVGDHQDALLAACRVAGFQHDRTDCEYVLG